MGNQETIDENDTERVRNLEFYKNKIESTPRGDLIENIHETWFGNHDLLEEHHGYVQWLFPIRESGMNSRSQPLSKFEASKFRSDREIRKRVIKSYELMLDFYGIVLLNKETGEVGRNPETFRERYHHLNRSFHNYLRITRLCKFLGAVGLEHYKFQFLNHIVLEVFKSKNLHRADTSCIRFWVPTLRRRENILALDKIIKKFGRRVNREGRDGWGDESGGNSWFTQYYPDVLANPNFGKKKTQEKVEDDDNDEEEDVKVEEKKKKIDTNHSKSFKIFLDIKTSDVDPYKEIRSKVEERMAKLKKEKEKRFEKLRRELGQNNNDSSSDDDDDEKEGEKEKKGMKDEGGKSDFTEDEDEDENKEMNDESDNNSNNNDEDDDNLSDEL